MWYLPSIDINPPSTRRCSVHPGCWKQWIDGRFAVCVHSRIQPLAKYILWAFVSCISVPALFRVGIQTMANLVLSKNLCNVCGMNRGFYNRGQVRDSLLTPKRKPHRLHDMGIAFICYGCMQEPIDERHKLWWQEVFHNHVVLADPMIENRVSQCLWSLIPYHPCRCGDCDPSWRLRGWICKG